MVEVDVSATIWVGTVVGVGLAFCLLPVEWPPWWLAADVAGGCVDDVDPALVDDVAAAAWCVVFERLLPT